MADEKSTKQGDEGQAPAKKGPPVKMVAAIAVLLVVEAAAVMMVMSMVGKPSSVKAVDVEDDHHDDGDTLVEIPLVKEQFTNNASGRMWIWNAEFIVQVRKKHAGAIPGDAPADDGHGGGHGGGHGDDHADEHAEKGVAEELAQRLAEVRTGVAAIMSRAQHADFTEPGRETLTRQTLEYLRGVFGKDAEGEERIQAVLIPRCLGAPTD